MTRPRLLLAEDHIGMRDRIVRLLESEFVVVGAVGDGQALLEAVARMKPDVCVIDISLPILSGIEAARQLKQSGSEAKVVFLTVHEDPDFLRAALAAGALGYVVKTRMTSDLRVATREAMAGRLFISPCVPYVTQTESINDMS